MLETLETDGRDDALAALEAHIAAGKYSPGDRLPPERELIVSLGISRSKLRQALEELEREGRIWRHVGKGTFLASDGIDSLARLSRRVSPAQMMRARLALEPALAREASINSSVAALCAIRDCKERAERAKCWEDYEACDDLFHRAIAEATGNELLLSLFDRLNQVRRAIAWNTVVRNSQMPPTGHSSFVEHNRIVSAIEARDPDSAFLAMRDHLGSVSNRLFGNA
ncbi:MAG: FCD domain-containing protein [Albidovulum sp.]|nr:FCD domain-containing protein [Albidovulum sp.]MDE0532655.1 FCD domain-containing protein [Albidovulum sp.]